MPMSGDGYTKTPFRYNMIAQAVIYNGKMTLMIDTRSVLKWLWLYIDSISRMLFPHNAFLFIQ